MKAVTKHQLKRMNEQPAGCATVKQKKVKDNFDEVEERSIL